jgi:hypothetical protein
MNKQTITGIRAFGNWQARGLVLAVTVLALAACDSATDVTSDESVTGTEGDLRAYSNAVVIDWNEHTVQALTTHDGYADPLPASRTLAMVHVAMHDAVSKTAYRRYHAYIAGAGDAWADPVAAAASAAHYVLLQQFPAQATQLQQWLDASLVAVVDGTPETRGVALGETVAQKVLARRAEDGSTETEPYSPGSAPGDYQLTADIIYRPGWQNVTPWGLDTANRFRPDAPPKLRSKGYARAYQEVKSKGRLDSDTRSEDETNFAKFWYEFSESGWNRIARVVATQERPDLAKTARLFALLNMALADSYVAGWDAKFFYDRWRPITAIHAGDTDNNPTTVPDATWEPLMTTPPVQDYPSTHSVLGDAAAEVLARVLRRDFLRFESTSTSFDGTRTWSSFTEAANENAESRIMAGIHFRFATSAGQFMGRQIGRYIEETQLQPLH